MSEPTPTPTPTPEPTPTPAPAPSPAPEKKESKQDDEVKAALEALKKSEADLKAKLAEYQKKEQNELDKQKTAEQKLAEKEAELAKARREALVIKVAAQKGLDTDLMDRVRGESEDEITADIELLLGKFAKTDIEGAKGGKTPSGKAGGNDEEEKPLSGQKAQIAAYMSDRGAALKK